MNPLVGSTVPQSTTAWLPSVTNTARDTLFPGNPITPEDFTRPMPSIVDTTPADVSQAAPCNSFGKWIQANPVGASLILMALAWIVEGKR